MSTATRHRRPGQRRRRQHRAGRHGPPARPSVGASDRGRAGGPGCSRSSSARSPRAARAATCSRSPPTRRAASRCATCWSSRASGSVVLSDIRQVAVAAHPGTTVLATDGCSAHGRRPAAPGARARRRRRDRPGAGGRAHARARHVGRATSSSVQTREPGVRPARRDPRRLRADRRPDLVGQPTAGSGDAGRATRRRDEGTVVRSRSRGRTVGDVRRRRHRVHQRRHRLGRQRRARAQPARREPARSSGSRPTRTRRRRRTAATDLSDLLPPWVGIVVAQLVVAVLVAALWRGRRLGPVVAEPLPVAVRAAETTEGRARLYRRRRARGRAADHLRAASLSPALGAARPARQRARGRRWWPGRRAQRLVPDRRGGAPVRCRSAGRRGAGPAGRRARRAGEAGTRSMTAVRDDRRPARRAPRPAHRGGQGGRRPGRRRHRPGHRAAVRGHVLLEGVPGTAKTLLVRALAAVAGAGHQAACSSPPT